MFKHILTGVAILSIIGCSSRPIKTAEYTDDGYVIAARTENVEVHAHHWYPIQQQRDVWLDVWLLRIANNDLEKDVCASIEWRQMDYVIHSPRAWFYLPPNSRMDIGEAIQQEWSFTNMTFTIDDAAFVVYRLNVIPPINGRCVVKSK